MRNLPNVDADKNAYLVELVRKQFNFMYGDAHDVGYLLDLGYLGDGMLCSLRKEIEDLFTIFPRKMAPQVKHERSSWQKNILLFGSKQKQLGGFLFKMIGKSKTVLQWWMADGTDWPLLHNVAKRVFSMAASSAASERNFSTFGFIHSKLQNRLGPKG